MPDSYFSAEKESIARSYERAIQQISFSMDTVNRSFSVNEITRSFTKELITRSFIEDEVQ